MKGFIYVFSIIYLFHGTALGQVNEHYTKKAKLICSLISPVPDFDYPLSFDEGFISRVKKEILINVFSTIYQKHGGCTDQVIGAESEASKRYFLILQDSYRSSFIISLDPQSLKVNGLLYEGDIRDKNYFNVEEKWIKAPDDIQLKTLIYKKTNSPNVKPVILMRTPYFQMGGMFSSPDYYNMAEYFLERGYHFALQAVKGTGGSEGEYKFFNPQEIQDGHATIDWISQQSFCNGNIGIVGTSYDGFTALAAGIGNHEALKIIMAGGSPSNIATDAFRIRGTMVLSILEYLKYNQTQKGYPFSRGFTELAIKELLNTPNLEDYDEILYGQDLSEWNLFAINYPLMDAPFWRERQIFTELKKIKIPTYHIAGMGRDGDMPDVIRNFTEIENNSLYKDQHHLILGFWDHGNSTPYGDGSNLSPFMKERFDKILAYYLKGEASDIINKPRVQVASNLGLNFIESDKFPLDQLTAKTIFFNRSDNKNSIDETSFSNIPSSTYYFKPLEINSFTDDQHLDFSFISKEDLPILGSITVNVFVKINTPQSDIFFVPYKRDKDGNEEFVTNCLLGQKIINKPDQIMQLTIKSCPIMHYVKKGETFGFYITSNLFPTIVRNRNNPLDDYFKSFSKAEITFYHSFEYPSSVTISLEPVGD